MYLDEINEKTKKIRSKSRNYISNIVYGKLEKEKNYPVICHENAIAIIDEERYRINVLFMALDEENLKELLQEIPQDSYVEFFHKEENNEKEKTFMDCGLSEYAKYLRETITYLQNPYSIKEEGRRAILQEMYDPDRGEYPQIEDAEEIYDMCMKVFDPTIDDVFSVDEWRDIIANKECIVAKEDGKIIAFYKWRIDGKKLYGNVSVNIGAANLLYDLERSVCEKYWNEGIRTIYSWVNCKNKKALNRGIHGIVKIIKAKSVLYQTIYKKN